MFNDLQVGTTIRFYLEFNDTYTVGVIQSVQESGYKVSVNGIGVSTVFVPFEDVIKTIDKNYKFEPVEEVEPIIEQEEIIEEEPIVEEVVKVKKSPFFGFFDDGGVAELTMANMPNELTIYIPLYDNDGTPASDEEVELRVSQVEEFMTLFFGEFHFKSVSGSYIDNEGKLVMQKHIQISTYITDEQLNMYKRHLMTDIAMWAVQWNQDSILMEYEDKIYHIYPLENMMKKGGELWIQEATKNMKKNGSVGAFTKQAKREGLTPIEFAKKVLAKPQGYTIKTRRRANFVKNVNPEKF